jgi:hypothetical protein
VADSAEQAVGIADGGFGEERQAGEQDEHDANLQAAAPTARRAGLTSCAVDDFGALGNGFVHG